MSQRNSRRSTKCVVFSLALISGVVWFLASGSVAQAQVTTADLVGTVKDTSGAVIPKAKVTATNVATGVTRTTTSGPAGEYTFPGLNPGLYTISGEIQGFRKVTMTGVTLEVNQHTRIDLTLQPGALVQTVEVTGAAPLINTEGADISTEIDTNRVVEMPLNDRNFLELATLAAGVNEGSPGTLQKGGLTFKQFAPSAAGEPASENNYQMDGTSNRDQFFHTYVVAPSVDAIQEFKMQVGQYSAEFGAGGGAVVNVVTKSGTNNFHGTMYEFLRNDVLDAANFFATSLPVPPIKRNLFGVSAGGPIKKNKAFVFGNYEGLRQVYAASGVGEGQQVSGATVSTVPTDAEKEGNLAGFGETLCNPTVPALTPPSVTCPNSQPFATPVIPSNLINQISKNFMAYYPEPNVPGAAVANYVATPRATINRDSLQARFDYIFSDKHALLARYNFQDFRNEVGGPFPKVGGSVLPQGFHNGTFGITSNLKPTLLNEFRFGFDRTNSRLGGQNTGNPICPSLGLAFCGSGFEAGFPESISLSKTTISNLGEQQAWWLFNTNFELYDGIAWTHDRHTIKAGLDIKHVRADVNYATHQNGDFGFSGVYTGDGFGDFLLGDPQGFLLLPPVPNAPQRYRDRQMAYYVLDEFKATPKLTFNLGLRYEYYQPPLELNGEPSLWDGSLGNGRGGLLYPEQNKNAVGSINAAQFYANQRPDLSYGYLNRRSVWTSVYHDFAPRFGFAWRPTGSTNTVVRGGYGWYYNAPDLINIVNNATVSPPSTQWPTFVGSILTPNLTYSGPVGVPVSQFLSNATFGVITGPEPNILVPHTQQWSLSLGQQVKQWAFQLQYLGSASTHLMNLVDYNWTEPTPGNLQTALPWPKWARVLGYTSGATANYNSLMVTAERRFAAGLTFKGSYTWGRSLGGRGSGYGDIQNPANMRAEYGPNPDDVRQRFVASYIYELPFGPKKHFGSNLKGAAGKLASGWQISGITSYRTGFPDFVSISSSNCNSSYDNNCYPDLVGKPILGGTGVNTPKWNVSAFDWPLNPAHPPEAPRFGNTQPFLLYGNPFVDWDLGLTKHTRFAEDRYEVEFRFETFNTFNEANFTDPNPDPESPLFGRTFGAQSPRDMQVGLKFYW